MFTLDENIRIGVWIGEGISSSVSDTIGWASGKRNKANSKKSPFATSMDHLENDSIGLKLLRKSRDGKTGSAPQRNSSFLKGCWDHSEVD